MKRYIGAASAVALFLSVGLAAAEEAVGKLQGIDQAMRTIVLDDGTSYQVAEGVALEGLAPGQEVTVSFEAEGAKKIATEVRPN